MRCRRDEALLALSVLSASLSASLSAAVSRLGRAVDIGHQLIETLEQIPAVVGAGARLGVILNAEGWDFEAADALDRLVVQVDMRDFDA